jgi:hypothetical protein
MERPASARFELKGSRTRYAITAVISSAATIALLALYFINLQNFSYLDRSSLLLAFIASICALLSVYSTASWLRESPMLVIDDRGITDCGGVGWEGYGLLPWENIEEIQTLPAKGGVYLAVKVKNFKELVSRSGRPFLPMLVSKVYGEKILLPMGYKDGEKARDQIPYFSKNRFY